MDKHNSFFADARGELNIFTIISALAGLSVICLPWAIVILHYANPERLDTAIYANFLLVAACVLTDAALGAIIERGLWNPGLPAAFPAPTPEEAAGPEQPAGPTPNLPVGLMVP